MLNKVILIGHVGNEPERKTTGAGALWTRFSLATSERWTDKRSGEKKERTEWLNIVSFHPPLIEFIESYVHKGSKLYIEGKIRTRSWEDKGEKRYATDIALEAFTGRIELLDRKKNPNEQMPDEGYGDTPGDAYQGEGGYA